MTVLVKETNERHTRYAREEKLQQINGSLYVHSNERMTHLDVCFPHEEECVDF